MLLAPPWPPVRASPCCPAAGCSTRARCGPALARLHAPAPASARPPPRRRALRLCCAGTPLQPPTQPPPPFDARRVFRATTKALSNLPLALGEMAVLAGLSAVGTVIEQNKSYSHYIQNYPLEPAVLGFVTYPFILDLGLDHIYTTWYFWAINVLLALSLAACSSTTQWPQLKVARDWRFLAEPAQLARLPVHDALPRASCLDLARALADCGYQTFVSRGGRLYAFKGLIGKMAPLGVHAALLLSMLGFLGSALGGTSGNAMVPEGSSFVIGDALKPVSFLAHKPSSSADRIQVDAFRVSYYPSGQVSQFYSDLSVLDSGSGKTVATAEMKVNVPLRYRGITAYQTDWGIAAVTVRVGERGAEATSAQSAQTLALPMVSLEGKAGFSGRIWGTFVPVAPLAGQAESSTPRGVSLVARDFQSVALYNVDGSFAGVRRPGSGTPIIVDGVPMVVEGLTGATGLELKSDPGVPIVYAGFAGVMITSFLSFVSHSQVWALEDEEGTLHVGGKTSKQKEGFQREMQTLLQTLPEYPADVTPGAEQ